MIMKAVLAAGLAAAAFAVVPQPASADTHVNVGIGVGGYGYDAPPGPPPCDRYNNWCGHGPGWRPMYAPPPLRGDVWNCRRGAMAVWNHGFNNVRPVQCDGPIMSYDATRYGRHWLVHVNRFNHRVW